MINAVDRMKYPLYYFHCPIHKSSYGLWGFSSKYSIKCVSLLTTSVSRDSRLSELWVSPPSQGSRSFSLCSPLILLLTAASVKLSETHTKNTYLCTADCCTQAHISTIRHREEPKDGTQSHCCSVTVYAGKRSCLKSFCHQLWRVLMEVLEVHQAHPLTTRHGSNWIGRINPFKKMWAIAWAGLGKANRDKSFWQCMNPAL